MRNYPEIFKVSEEQMRLLVAAGMRGGGDWCDLYFEYTTYNDLMLKDSEVTSGGFHIDYGVGIRVLKGDKTGYAYSESTEMQDMMAAARAAAAISLASGSEKPSCGCFSASSRRQAERPHHNASYHPELKTSHPELGSGSDGRVRNKFGMTQRFFASPHHNFYPIALDWRGARMSDFVPFLKKLEALVMQKDSRVAKVIAKLSSSQSDIMMYNSLGELTADTRPMCSITLSVIFTQNGENENKTVSRSFRYGAEWIGEALAEEMAAEAVGGIDARFEAKRPKGGEMPVVMRCGASGILLHEAMGHAFEADFNRKGQSIFSDKMGSRICSEEINIVDDATLPHNRGSINYDDEGVSGQKTYMVKDGMLNSYLHDRISAAHYGMESTGNGRRESFRYNPIPRMRATYMENGSASHDDIIASVSKGIYVDEFSNGQVKIGEGDFTFYVKSGFLIENGRLTAPIKDINVIGNGPKALADISAVGNDLRMDNGTWTCGKEQSVAVSVGIPTVLIKSLIVGGE